MVQSKNNQSYDMVQGRLTSAAKALTWLCEGELEVSEHIAGLDEEKKAGRN